MDNQNNKHSGVFDMINSYADQHNMANDDIFKGDTEKHEIIAPIRKEVPKKTNDSDKESNNGIWVPSDEDLDGLNEMKRQSGIIYKKDDWKENIDPAELKNILDDKVSQNALDQMDEMGRAAFNIDASKKRLGIKHLNIPTIFNSRIMDAASDKDYSRAAYNLDTLIKSITDQFPDAIVERLPIENVNNNQPDTNVPEHQMEIPESSEATHVEANVSNADIINNDATNDTTDNCTISESKIIIDKSQVSNISFSRDDIDKIKKSRSVVLNIVETKNVEYSIIEEDNSDGNTLDIDTILRQYTRKMNDMRVSMPASRYRASFTGLSYPEILDLSYSQELNNLDGEKKKWTIVYNHIKNPSIGEFKEYEYTNAAGETIKVSAFEDFLMKTSYMDLEFALWAVLCATCLEKEVVSIDCHGNNCKNTYEWVYDPRALIQMDSVPVVTLDDMKVTGELTNMDAIMKHYNGSMLKLSNSVKLPSSGFVVCFGHISAYDYLTTRLTDIMAVEENQSSAVSSIFEASGLTVIKYLLLPVIDGDQYRKISKGPDIMKVVHSLDELDCRVINELMEMMVNPYKFKFSLKDLECPKCHTKTAIDINDISLLLFLIAQSLSNSEVRLIQS